MNKIMMGSLSLLMVMGVYKTTYAGDSVSQQIQLLNSQLQTQIQKVQADQQKQVQTMNTQVQAQLKQMQTDLQAQIQKVNAQTQAQMKQIQTTLQEQIKEVQKQAVQSKTQ